VKAIVVLTTVGAKFDAAALARTLVEQRLAACVNIVPAVHSIYRWKNAVEDDREQLLVIKTTESRVDALRESLFAVHPYEVPEFVVLGADAGGAYAEWLIDSVAAPAAP
jgi:periplasmic divalent cation tolerance protein